MLKTFVFFLLLTLTTILHLFVLLFFYTFLSHLIQEMETNEAEKEAEVRESG